MRDRCGRIRRRAQLRRPASIAEAAEDLLKPKVRRVDHGLDCTAQAMEHQPVTRARTG